jgi:hypothetical protein
VLERARAIVDLTVPNCLAVGTCLFCAYLYLRGIPIPDELKVSAAAASGWVFNKTKDRTGA